MSTRSGATPEVRSRRARTTQRRRRAFASAFAIVLTALVVFALGGGLLSTLQGPRVTSVDVAPEAATQASGSRLIITTNQSLNDVTADQVTVTPATDFTVDTSGRSIGVRFALPLYDATDYTVTIKGVTGIGSEPASTFTETFTTPALDAYLLKRTDSADTIFRTDLTGEAAVPVFENEHIEDFRATANHLVISVRNDATPTLVVTDLDGENPADMTLPGDGQITLLQSADRGDLIGYVYSDAVLTETTGENSALYTASLDDPTAAPTLVTIEGADPRVAQWRFVPDTDSVLVLTFGGRLLLTDATGDGAVDLGAAVTIDGIARGSSVAVIERADGMFAIDLTDGTESPLVDAADTDGLPGTVLPLPGDEGTLRPFALIGDDGIAQGTMIGRVASDGTTTSVYSVAAGDALLQSCVSPSGRYAAVTVAPDIVANPYDTYLLPVPTTVETHVIDLDTDDEVVALAGLAISWCQVPLQ
ncbi:hypothetical protein FHX48_002084 [Microbacterium halimionae]|uniref:SbsA Ig-like domain-containing protein n=1 Tax=Microbacterium halimionae TaxID=1526413 RepID=A0A7W3PLW7_9MICO|nr:hypothetical protein [Microbacterium halimionae]MBA8816990.1 hypothetical protein [Microbacterium halimionae]NII94471.1 hypothetical protein [Microbacterium halimionae]